MEPAWLTRAKGELGVAEIPGSASNRRIIEYFARAGHPNIADEVTAWCSAFACWCFELENVASARTLWARSWAKWGVPLRTPQVGAVVVLTRGDGGHVGFFMRYSDDERYVLLLGGNQSNKVCYQWFPVDRIISIRWPNLEVYAPPPPPTTTLNGWTSEVVAAPELTRPAHIPPPVPVYETEESRDDVLDRLRDNGSRIVAMADKIKRWLGGTAFTGFTLGSFGLTTGQLILAGSALALICIAAYLYFHTDKIIAARIDDDMQGLHVGRK